jgi:hypothetical protein
MQKNLVRTILVLGALSCAFFFYKTIKVDQPKVEVEEEVNAAANSLPSDFHTFYDQFHPDSTFQLSRVIFPLSGVVQVGDSVLTLVEKQWLKDEWKLHKPFDNHGGTFERTFTNTGGIITETIVGNGGMFSLEKRYSKLAGEWHLIYYQGLMMHG